MTTGVKVQKLNEFAPTYTGAAAVTLSDSNELGTYSRALYIGTNAGGTGDLKVTMVDGQVVTFNNIPVGLYPIAAKLVWSTGTSVADVTALW